MPFSAAERNGHKYENDTKYGDWFGYPGYAWCAMFVSWCARQAEVSTDIIKRCSWVYPNGFGVPYYNGREYTPLPGEEWTRDESGHWYACRDCGEKLGFASHTPGPEATITAAQICTVCQFELAPVIPHDHVFNGQGTLHFHSCACGETYEAEAADCEICAAFPWWIVCIVEAVVFGGAIVWIILAMRKRGKWEA